jgi:osmotically-inducible protein OsmY
MGMSLFDMFNFDPSSTPGFFPQNQGSGPSYDFPAQQFRDDSFASFMNPMQNLMQQMPQTQNYFSALSQGPTVQNSQPSLGRTIGSALAGLAQSVTNPSAGAAIAAQGMAAPYERKVDDYQRNIANLGRSAQQEQGLMGLSRQFANDQFTREQQGFENRFKEDQLGQAGQLGNRKLDVEEKDLSAKIAQANLDRALQEKKITIDQYNSESQRISANSNAARDSAMSDYYRRIATVRENPTPKAKPESNAVVQSKLKAELLTDPTFEGMIDYQGRINPEELNKNPNAMERLRQIYRRLGLAPSNDIGLQ